MQVRLGLLRLVDGAAPVLAAARGLLAAEGLEMRFSVEPSWATLADRLAWGALDAAVMLPPLALAAAAGLRGGGVPLVVPMGLSAGGNSIALGHAPAEAAAGGGGAVACGRRLLRWLRAQSAPPRFAVVHAFSTHAVLLRYWLAAAGADPDGDIEIVVVPPQHVTAALAEGRIAGFCAGAPWGEAAERSGAGRVLFGSSAIWQGHPEKCLALAAPWAAAHPAAVKGLLRALLQAGRICDRPAEADGLAALLAARLDLPEDAVRATLPGGQALERVRFAAGATWYPWLSQGAWWAAQMGRWGWLPPAADALALAHEVYRPDLLAPAAGELGLPWPVAGAKTEGGHSCPWRLPGNPEPLPLEADQFCDSLIYSENGQILQGVPTH